jgi:hypothetical protein
VNEQNDDAEDRVPGDLDAQQHEHVAQVLAAAAAAPVIPDRVAARLDAVLAQLVSDPSADPSAGDSARSAVGPAKGTEPPGTVTPLDSRRRRRWPQLLVAAAAVSVLGLGAGNLLGDLSGGQAEQALSADEAGGGAEREGGPAATAPDNALVEEDGGPSRPQDLRGATAPGQPRSGGSATDTSGPKVRSGSLTLDLQRIEDFALAYPVDTRSRAWSRACVHPRTGPRDQWLPIRLDGTPAVLVLRAPEGGRRTGEVFTCGDPDTPAVSTTVDAR